MTNGLILTPHGPTTFPPSTKRTGTSRAARPYSPDRSYGLAGNVPAPSVSLRALAKNPRANTVRRRLRRLFTPRIAWYWSRRPVASTRYTFPEAVVKDARPAPHDRARAAAGVLLAH